MVRTRIFSFIAASSLMLAPAFGDEGPGAASPEAPRSSPPMASSSDAGSDYDAPGAHLRVDAKVLSGLLGFSGLTPSLVVGAQWTRLTVGLGLSFSRYGFSTSSGAGNTLSSFDSSVTFVGFSPTATYDLIRSKDNRAALYALVALVPSLMFTNSSSVSGGTPSTSNCGTQSNFIIGYQAALGARVSIVPQFQLGVEAGPTGQISSLSFGCPTNSNSESVGLHGFYGGLVGSFTTR